MAPDLAKRSTTDKIMARYIGPKNKLARRAGQDLGLKTTPSKLISRLNIPPGQHGRRGTRKMSEYGLQLKEKQTLKRRYGILEKQFNRYYKRAIKQTGATGHLLLQLLELRLDNVVYRLGLAPTRAAARQLVNHGHVKVNNQKIDIPSYQVNINDTISISNKATKIPYIAALLEIENPSLPKWLQRKSAVGKVKSLPDRDDIDYEVNENLIIEYYSR